MMKKTDYKYRNDLLSSEELCEAREKVNMASDEALEEVRRITLAHGSIACTGCRYCTEVCPIDMPIPEIFSFMNSGRKAGYDALVTNTKASDCLQCGRCEKACPQHLPIRRYLGNAAFRFERK